VEAVSSSNIILPVSNAAFACVEKRALLVGGWNGGGSVSQVLEYDLAARTWSIASPFPISISEAQIVSLGGTLVLFGGWNDKTVLGDTWILSTQSAEGKPAHWSRLAGQGPEG